MAFTLKSLPKISSELGLQKTLDLDHIGLIGHSIGGEAVMRIAHNPLLTVQAAVSLDAMLIPEPLSREQKELELLSERHKKKRPVDPQKEFSKDFDGFPPRDPSGGFKGFDLPFMRILGGAIQENLVHSLVEAGSIPKADYASECIEHANALFDLIPLKKDNYKVLLPQATHGCFGDLNLEKHLVPGLAIQEVWSPQEPHFEANYRDTDLLLLTFFDRFLKGESIALLKLNSPTIRIEGAVKGDASGAEGTP